MPSNFTKIGKTSYMLADILSKSLIMKSYYITKLFYFEILTFRCSKAIRAPYMLYSKYMYAQKYHVWISFDCIDLRTCYYVKYLSLSVFK